MELLIAVIWFGIWLLLLGLAFFIIVWVLGILGIAIDPKILKIVGAIIVLLVLLWFIQAVVGGGGVPRLRL